MKKLILILAVLLLSGCWFKEPIKVYVNSSEPEKLIEATANAVDWWNELFSVDIFELRISDHPNSVYLNPIRRTVVVNSRNFSREEHQGSTTTIDLIHFRTAIQKDVIDYLEQGRLTLLIAHELGHTLTLTHVDDIHNIMYGNCTPKDPIITSQQRKRVEAFFDFPLANF